MNKTSLLRRTAALAAAILITAALTACGDTPSDPSSTVNTAPSTTQTVPTTTAAPKLGLNALTGLRDMETDNDRPIGFVVTDETANLTQLNLESADLYFEAETEAGIPRILAIYASVDRIPERIGPVRSARPHFVKIAQALDCIYCHIGGSDTGLKTIRALGVDDMTGAYVKDPTLTASKNYSWNRSAFTREKVNDKIRRSKLRTKSEDRVSPFSFGTQAGDRPAATVDVKISEAYNIAFTYDAASGLYQKHRNALSTAVHKTATGGTIEAANVIVMFDRRFMDEMYTDSNGHTAPRYDFDLKEGIGLLASGGTARDIRWTRSSGGLLFFEQDGSTPLVVSPGKTFICLASSTLQNRTKVQ